MQILENEPMNKHTSFKVGGPARFFVKAESVDDLKEALAMARKKGLPHFILGNGTNLLVSDKGYEGVVITLAGEFSEIPESFLKLQTWAKVRSKPEPQSRSGDSPAQRSSWAMRESTNSRESREPSGAPST